MPDIGGTPLCVLFQYGKKQATWRECLPKRQMKNAGGNRWNRKRQGRLRPFGKQ